MFRPFSMTVALILLLAVQLRAQPTVDQDISDLALVLTVAYDNMNRGSDADVRKLLNTIKEPLRGTPHRLLERLSAEPDVKQAILGKPVPKPDNQFLLAALHPSEPKVVFVCNHGVVVILVSRQRFDHPSEPTWRPALFFVQIIRTMGRVSSAGTVLTCGVEKTRLPSFKRITHPSPSESSLGCCRLVVFTIVMRCRSTAIRGPVHGR